ncbi:MAG: hypothetical protein WCF77_00955 [Minisyncoccia bacterium]
MKQRIAITSPVPSTPTADFLKKLPAEYDWIVVDDSDGKLDLPRRKNVFSYDYAAQKKILGKFYGRFLDFHHSSSCRNLAHYLAYKEGYDVVFALDYDCAVPKNFIKDHLAVFKEKKNKLIRSKSGWVNPLGGSDWYSRGFPYSERNKMSADISVTTTGKKVVLNMGLWENVVDINGIDKVLAKAPSKIKLAHDHLAVDGIIPLCGMNNAFLRETIPAYFFLPNFKVGNWAVSRHDDIWGGYMFQKLAHKKGDLISFGKPVVFHERESNQPRVLSYEHFMNILEPYFYEIVDAACANVKKSGYREMFADFSENFEKEIKRRKNKLPATYYVAFAYLGDAIKLWKEIFQKSS